MGTVTVPEPVDRRPTAVAAFDVDRTLVTVHAFTRFLIRSCGTVPWLRAVAWATIGRPVGVDRDERKALLLHSLLGGLAAEEVGSRADEFARWLRSRIDPDVLRCLRRHQAGGHGVVLVSAGLAVYLRPLATFLGADAVLALELEEERGLLTGAVVGGGNVRGPRKAELLTAFVTDECGGRDRTRLYAYGDSDGDREMLALADAGYLVRQRRFAPTRFVRVGAGGAAVAAERTAP